MKIRCDCGNLILDQSPELTCKGLLISSMDYSKVWDNPTDKILKLIEAISQNTFKKWVLEHYPDFIDLELNDLIFHILNEPVFDYKKDVYECESCGSLLVFNEENARPLFYLSSSSKYNKILDTRDC